MKHAYTHRGGTHMVGRGSANGRHHQVGHGQTISAIKSEARGYKRFDTKPKQPSVTPLPLGHTPFTWMNALQAQPPYPAPPTNMHGVNHGYQSGRGQTISAIKSEARGYERFGHVKPKRTLGSRLTSGSNPLLYLHLLGQQPQYSTTSGNAHGVKSNHQVGHGVRKVAMKKRR